MLRGSMPPLSHEDRVFAFALAAAALPGAFALVLLWVGDFDAKTRWTVALAIVVGGVGLAAAARARVVRPLATLTNLIASLREGDYTMRGRPPRRDDSLGAAMGELNALADQLRGQRFADEETAAGLTRVVDGLDVAVLVLARDGVVRLANPAAARLLGQPAHQLVGRDSAGLGVAELLAGESPRTVALALPGGSGPWQARRSDVRIDGVPHQLVVLTDIQRTLREEERAAWQRLVRVLGHEINNSLSPIQSIASTLRSGAARPERPDDYDDDLARGLEVIERRAAALGRFMTSYARLARLPPPQRGRVELSAWVARVAALETRRPVTVEGGPPLAIDADADQLDQVLINLVGNAVDAAAETGGGVRIRWRADGPGVELVVEDDGPGIAATANLFVPFFTTKPGGSGIGLVLSRQIVEAHGGRLVLRSRTDASGCQAVITLPRLAV